MLSTLRVFKYVEENVLKVLEVKVLIIKQNDLIKKKLKTFKTKSASLKAKTVTIFLSIKRQIISNISAD